MKVIVLSSKSSHKDLFTYGAELMDELHKTAPTVTYDHIEPDFSNIPELFDADEKIVLFNHFALPDGFTKFSENLPKFKNVQYLLSPYSAYEGLNLELLKKLNVRYRNNGGANANSVAQYALTVMLMLLSKFPVFTQSSTMPNGAELGEEFHNKSVGIIGMGNVGRCLLKSVNGLGMKAAFYNRKRLSEAAPQVSFDEAVKSDIIFITIATNEETKALLKDFAAKLEPHQYVIDISAADDLYDKSAVVELLNKDLLRGYGLEIFDPQQLKLSSHKNFVATPHIAWCTADAEQRTVQNYLRRTLAILKGEADSIDFIV